MLASAQHDLDAALVDVSAGSSGVDDVAVISMREMFGLGSVNPPNEFIGTPKHMEGPDISDPPTILTNVIKV